MKRAVEIILEDSERTKLEDIIRTELLPDSIPTKASLYAKIILRCAEGKQSKDVAKEFGVSNPMVSYWRRRFSIYRTHCL